MDGTLPLKVGTALGIMAYCLVMMASKDASLWVTVTMGVSSLSVLAASIFLMWRVLAKSDAERGPICRPAEETPGSIPPPQA